MKIKRDIFIYLEGNNATFAQCGSCALGHARCAIMGGAKVSPKIGSCDFYMEGGAFQGRPIARLSREQTGYVERPVRCENCKFYGAGHCNFFAQLNRDLPALFDLDEKVGRHACCNANTAK